MDNGTKYTHINFVAVEVARPDTTLKVVGGVAS